MQWVFLAKFLEVVADHERWLSTLSDEEAMHLSMSTHAYVQFGSLTGEPKGAARPTACCCAVFRDC